jgi:hypothetical protein
MKATNICLTPQQIKALKKLAETSGLSVSDLVRRAVDEYLREEKKQ